MPEKEFPVELPISSRIILMQGAVAGLKHAFFFFKKKPGSAHTGGVRKYSGILVGR